jgi:hypothetical protein
MGDFGMAEPDATCPVSLDTLGQLYRANKLSVPDILRDVPEDKRARLALFCYNRSHLRDLALTIAETCDPVRLGELAGTLGQVLAAQCRSKVRSFGIEPGATGIRPKAKISLAGGRG